MKMKTFTQLTIATFLVAGAMNAMASDDRYYNDGDDRGTYSERGEYGYNRSDDGYRRVDYRGDDRYYGSDSDEGYGYRNGGDSDDVRGNYRYNDRMDGDDASRYNRDDSRNNEFRS